MKTKVCQKLRAGVGSKQRPVFIVKLEAVTTDTGIDLPSMAGYRCPELLRQHGQKAKPCRQVCEGVSKQPQMNVGSVLGPSVPGGRENKHQQVILTIAAGFKSCMSSHNCFISFMSFEK